jgi:ligand-binding sensor domain-containing protein
VSDNYDFVTVKKPRGISDVDNFNFHAMHENTSKMIDSKIQQLAMSKTNSLAIESPKKITQMMNQEEESKVTDFDDLIP